MLTIAGGILIAFAIMAVLRHLGTIILFLVVLYLIGSCVSSHAEPYSCQMYREAARKCAANTIGKCYVEAEMERLRKQCLRDGGNP